MSESGRYVVVYEAQGQKAQWKALQKAFREAGVGKLRASFWEDDPMLYVYPLDPRDFGKKGRIDRKIYTIRVRAEDADPASEIVLRLVPDYVPYVHKTAPSPEKEKISRKKDPEDTFLGMVRAHKGYFIFFAVALLAMVIYMVFIRDFSSPASAELSTDALERMPSYETQIPGAPLETAPAAMPWYLLPFLLSGPLIIIMMFVTFFRGGRAHATEPAGSSYVSDHLREGEKKTFRDIGGLKPLKEDLQVVVDFLKTPDKYHAAGADLPRGLLLVGPPGTGKTLIAQVMANEARVNFLYANASDFVEKYVGTGAARIRSLFKKARKDTPCIVFIDEVDTLCGKRGKDMNAEDRKALTALLTEMDGFRKSDNLLVIGATNRVEDIDEAALRPGRFTEIYTVPIPETVEERLEVIDIYMKNKKFAEDFDRRAFAREMMGRSPAEIKDILNEAAIISVQRGLDYINKECVEIAFYKRLMHGHQTDHDETDPDDLRTIAYHEAGHTLIARLTGSRVTKVTIMPSTSGAGGVTFIQPFEKKLHTKTMMEHKVMELYGGKVAEYLVHGRDWDKTSQGCANDIRKATEILKNMVDAYGMSENGLVNMGMLTSETGETSTRYIVEMSEQLKQRTVDLMEENITLLETLAEELLVKDTLYEDEINTLLHLTP
ncbi:MAG: AAA family ATPase [Lachnospiraceae bacterium]|nr:AAA family ATPase [Lachnospiraceae bacterium]